MFLVLKENPDVEINFSIPYATVKSLIHDSNGRMIPTYKKLKEVNLVENINKLNITDSDRVLVYGKEMAKLVAP